MSLIVTGSVGIDTVETPGKTVQNLLGGSAVYFSAAASFFSPVRLVAAVGEDFPDSFLKTFRHFGADLTGLERRAGSKTFRWHGRYHEDMNHRDTVDVQLNVLAEKQPPVPEKFRDSQYVFLANTDPAAQLQLLSQFPKRILAVADTMDLWIKTQRPTLLKLLKQVDGLVLNNDEAEQLTGQDNLVRAAKAVVKMGPKFVVAKKGEHGAILAFGDSVIAMPAWPAEKVIDPTGAGDTFAGGFMGYLASVKAGPLTSRTSLGLYKQAMACGTVVASFSIEAFSLDRLKQLTRRDVMARIQQYRKMLSLT